MNTVSKAETHALIIKGMRGLLILSYIGLAGGFLCGPVMLCGGILMNRTAVWGPKFQGTPFIILGTLFTILLIPVIMEFDLRRKTHARVLSALHLGSPRLVWIYIETRTGYVTGAPLIRSFRSGFAIHLHLLLDDRSHCRLWLKWPDAEALWYLLGDNNPGISMGWNASMYEHWKTDPDYPLRHVIRTGEQLTTTLHTRIRY